MPLVPEGARPRQDVRASIAGQFWGMETASASSIDGKTDLLPCEPVALGPTASTGLSRCQQLIAAQALAIPALPSYCHRDGGVVRVPLFAFGLITVDNVSSCAKSKKNERFE